MIGWIMAVEETKPLDLQPVVQEMIASIEALITSCLPILAIVLGGYLAYEIIEKIFTPDQEKYPDALDPQYEPDQVDDDYAEWRRGW